MKRKILMLLLFFGCWMLPSCILPDCSRCDFAAGERVVLHYPIPCDTCTITRVANQSGCVFFPRPSSDRCADVNSVSTGGGFRIFSASPASVNLQAPPATFTITGEAMSAAYGMPVLEFYDDQEVFVAQVSATAIASDGTWVQANAPDLSSVYSGQYNIEVSNVTWNGNRQVVGTAAISTYGRDRPPCDPTGSKERSCYNQGGDWEPSNCSCYVDPCLRPNIETGELPICY